jgi:hypothetical protein
MCIVCYECAKTLALTDNCLSTHWYINGRLIGSTTLPYLPIHLLYRDYPAQLSNCEPTYARVMFRSVGFEGGATAGWEM